MCSNTPPGCAVSYGDTRAIFIGQSPIASRRHRHGLQPSCDPHVYRGGPERTSPREPECGPRHAHNAPTRLPVLPPIITKAGYLDGSCSGCFHGRLEIFGEMAGNPMPRFQLPEDWGFEGAALGSEWTARPKT